MIHPLRSILAVFLVAVAVVLAVSAAPAAAKGKTPCWKTLINDWYDGRIDGTYEIHCYREALQHLPTDVDTYSSAREDIKQALQKRITQGAGGGSSSGGGTSTSGSSPGGSGGAGGGSGGSGGTSGSGGGSSGSGSKNAGGGKSASGPITDVLNAGRPGKADSLPIPLIVLGGVALLLMAAGGAGFLARRSRMRRTQLASLPQGHSPSEPG